MIRQPIGSGRSSQSGKAPAACLLPKASLPSEINQEIARCGDLGRCHRRKADSFLLKEAENADAVGGADVDLAVRDGRGDEFVAVPKMIATVGSLTGAVEVHQSNGVIGVKHGRISILHCPHNGVLRSVGRNARSCSRIAEGIARSCYRTREELRVLELKCQQWRTYRGIVDVGTECSRRGPDSAGEGAREFLVDLVAGGIEFPHVIPVNDIEIAVLTGSHGEIPQDVSSIFLIRQESSAGAEISVTAVLLRLVVLFKVVKHSEAA